MSTNTVSWEGMEKQLFKVEASRTWNEFFISVVKNFFIGGIIVSLLVSLPNFLSGEMAWSNMVATYILNGTIWVVLSYGNGFIVDRLEDWVPWLERPVLRLVLSLVVTCTYTVIAGMIPVLLYLILYYGMSIEESYDGIGDNFFVLAIGITILVSLFLHGRGFFFAWKRSIVEAEEHKRAAIASQYESLKNQVNPHFLFNSLNVLSNLVYKDQDLAAKFIKQLSKVYRYVLETKDEEVVPLSTELESLNSYLFLLKMRFGESLNVRIELEEVMDGVIAPLSLQMLVENAVKHNIVAKAQPLHLHIFAQADYIIVSNNLQKKSNPQESSGIGLPNIKARYEILAEQPVKINETENVFEVHLPIIKLSEVV